MRLSPLALLTVLAAPAAARTRMPDCNASAAAPVVHVALPGHPFGVVASGDGCWVFVSLMGPASTHGMAVLRRDGGSVEVKRVVPLEPAPGGMVLTHDGKLLIAASGSLIRVLDVHRLVSGDEDPELGSFTDGPGAGSIYVNVTADDTTLFVSDEFAAAITVIDLARARSQGFKGAAEVGKIPVGMLPIALVFSRDGRWLYTTSEAAAADWGWPKACKEEGSQKTSLDYPEGAVVVVDGARARTDPAHAVVARVPAGCSAVRLAMAPHGNRIYVTARNSNAVLAFDTRKLLKQSDRARVGLAPVGSSPVPVAVIDGGKTVLAGNSNRFAADPLAPQTLTVLRARKLQKGAAAVMGTVATGAFPRELRLSADGRTLFLTNFFSNSLQVMDVARLPLKSNR